MRQILYVMMALLATGCAPAAPVADEETGGQAPIFPDYAGCTVPPNIAPLNFALEEPYDEARAVFHVGGREWVVTARRGQFTIPPRKWRKMIDAAGEENTPTSPGAGSGTEAGDKGRISVKVSARRQGRWRAYEPWEVTVADEPADPYIAYRLIEPGYTLWNRIGIYQRKLESFNQTAILENSTTRGSCMNCHSFAMQDPDRMLLHLRGSVAATMVVSDGGRIEKLNTRTPQTMSALVYPSWHPEGRFVAFSVNDTKQGFHMNDANRVEVYDNESDVVVYDTATHEIITTPMLHGTDTFESFPTFSPDGRTLYFSSARFVADVRSSPDSVRYSLCAIGFDAPSRTFGTTVDTLYNARVGGPEGVPRSASFPRVSPDGRWLLYTLSDYGGFGIWHKESDLWMIDLATGEHAALDAANGPDSDSYHSWSSNSRWIMFASRRMDGLYSRPFIAHIDPEGRAGKAFPLPQRDVRFYDRFMYSYNVPEFIKGPVKNRRRKISKMAKDAPGTDVRVISGAAPTSEP